MNDFFQTPVEFLKGVGPQRADLLKKELGIHTYKDLLYHFPFRYINRSIFCLIKDLPYLENAAQFKGTITRIIDGGRGRAKSISAHVEDETGKLELIWFQGASWIKNSLKVGASYQIFGKAKIYNNQWTIAHPEITPWNSGALNTGFQPVYSTTEKLTANGLGSRGIEKIMQSLLQLVPSQCNEILSQEILNQLKCVSLVEALLKIHAPTTENEVAAARFRLKFDELFYLQLEMQIRRQVSATKGKGFVFPEVGTVFNSFYTSHLPFELTGAQKKVLKEIRKDFLVGKHMNRLLQGDVGSGKTLVALLTALIAIGNNFQAALMAPTEILATQHFETISKLVEKLPIHVSLLTGSTKKSKRVHIHEGLENGEIHLLIGTHALLENVVQFQNLGVVIIDEQHRFGVAQRAKMWRKNTTPPHVLIMTATPIPRTLAMTFYGDLDVSVIDELPPGRKPISTIHRFESHRLRLFEFMREQIKLGRQIYVVYPLIKESEKLDFANLMDGYEAISRSFPLPEYRVSIVHGQMKPEDKEFEMQRFIKGETQIMVATTVIEVGVNVPNASVMIIESAERFGLSQLHQLRGRVGRGAEKSYCILMTGNKLSKEAKLRMETMVGTNDGFEIAEVDLKLRGPGDLMGTQQSGVLDLKIADISKDSQLVILAREIAVKLIEADPTISDPTNRYIREEISKIVRSKPNWGKIA
jgi:ATP-dependent DNA helicase RecG